MLRLLYVEVLNADTDARLHALRSASPGLQVTIAATPAAARSCLAAGTYDVLLVSDGLPGADVAGLVEEARRAEAPTAVVMIGGAAGGQGGRGDHHPVPDGVLPLDLGGAEQFHAVVAGACQRARARSVEGRPLRSAPPQAVRVLVIDDEVAIIGVVRRALERAGMTVDTAQRGHDGLERLRTEAYDVVLCDLRMPDMSGQQIYAHLSESMPEVTRRLIFLTGDVATESTTDFLRSSGCPYIAKPFDLRELVRSINELAAALAA
jgi:DNA-binding response OmpR family regulator